MEIRRGDIVWLNQELSCNLGKNVQEIDRPYVVISNNINNRLCPTVNLACLSRQTDKSKYPMHVLIDCSNYNLKHDSVIFVEQLLTVNKNEISKKITRLNKKDMESLNKAICIQLIDEKQSFF